MKERLVELVKSAPYGSETLGEYFNTSYIENCIVQHLLENGVIVPPCKVGDEVYFNHAELNETCPAKVIKITNNYHTPSMPLWITIEYKSELIGRQEVEMVSEVFKLVCFHTKEEAEAKLKEGADNEHK